MQVKWPAQLDAEIGDPYFAPALIRDVTARLQERAGRGAKVTSFTVDNPGDYDMQRLFTIELRVDYRDEAKNKIMEKAVQQAARHVYSTAGLLADNVKPQVVLYSHDYYTGHAEIPLLDDDIAAGNRALEEVSISAEMAEALGGKK